MSVNMRATQITMAEDLIASATRTSKDMSQLRIRTTIPGDWMAKLYAKQEYLVC